MREITVLEDPGAAVAERLSEVAERGGDIVLTGGSTPRAAYARAAEADADWSRATVWFSDERMVPPDHPDSNFAMAAKTLLSRLSKPPTVVRMQGELGAEAAAGAYEALIRERMGPEPRFDLLLLGVGPDSHCASLFPGKPELEERGRFVAPVPIAGMEPQVPRTTLTFPVLNNAREVDFLISGPDKADAVARAFTEPPDPAAPAGRVRPSAGSLFVYLDEAAASRLQ
jgi:6-phosphogluconolactonase